MREAEVRGAEQREETKQQRVMVRAREKVTAKVRVTFFGEKRECFCMLQNAF